MSNADFRGRRKSLQKPRPGPLQNFEQELQECPTSSVQEGYHFPWDFSTKTYSRTAFPEKVPGSKLSEKEVAKTIKELEQCPTYPLSFSSPKVTCLMILVSIVVGLAGFFLMLWVHTWTLAFPVFLVVLVAGVYGSVLLSQPGLACYMRRRRRALEAVLSKLQKDVFDLHDAVITLSPEQSYISIVMTSPSKEEQPPMIILSRDKQGSRKMIVHEGSQKAIAKTDKVIEGSSQGFFNIAREIGVFVKRKRKEYVNYPKYVEEGGEKLEFTGELPVKALKSIQKKDSLQVINETGADTRASNRGVQVTEKKTSNDRSREEKALEEAQVRETEENLKSPKMEVSSSLYDQEYLQSRRKKRREFLDYTSFVKKEEHKVEFHRALQEISEPPREDLLAGMKRTNTVYQSFKADRDEEDGHLESDSLGQSSVSPKKHSKKLHNFSLETTALANKKKEDDELLSSIKSRLQ